MLFPLGPPPVGNRSQRLQWWFRLLPPENKWSKGNTFFLLRLLIRPELQAPGW